MSTPENLAEHNVVATFDAPDEARSALSNLQNEGYRDAVSEGRVLVGFHSDDQGEVELAAHVLRMAGARTVDRLDSKGQPVT